MKSVFVFLLLAAVFVPTSASAQGRGNQNNEKWTICHATKSSSNPYIKITVSNRSQGGHFDNQGNPLHGGDLLLAGDVPCPVREPLGVPEFGLIQGGLAALLSTGTLLGLRRKLS